MACNDEKDCTNILNPGQDCLNLVTKDIFSDEGIDNTQDSDRCCGLTTIEFIAVMCSVLGAAFVSLIIFICLVKKGVIKTCCGKKICCFREKDENGSEESEGYIYKTVHTINVFETVEQNEQHKLLAGTKIEDPESRYT